MVSLLFKRQLAARAAFVGARALIFFAIAGVELLLWIDPIAFLVLVSAVYVTVLSLFLIQRPLTALYVALFIRLFPPEILPPLIYQGAEYGALAVACFAWIVHAPYQRQPIQWNGVFFLAALYILWGSVTLLWAPDTGRGIEKLLTYGFGLVLLFLLINQINSVRAIDGIMRVLEILGWTLAILGLYAALFSGFHFGERLTAFGQNENQFGLMLIVTLPGVIWPVSRSMGPKRSLRIALSILYILCTLILVLLSASRGSTLSLAIVLFALYFWKPVRPWAIMGSILVAGMLVSTPFLLDTLNNRFEDRSEVELGGRPVLWEASWQLIQDHPLTGMGVGNGRYELHHYLASLTNSYASRDDLPSHNPLLEVGVDTGLFGMLLYASICVSAVWQFVRSRGRRFMREGPLAAYFPIVLVCAAGYLATFVKGGGIEDHPTFFLLLALLTIPSHLPRDSGSTIDRPVARAQSANVRTRFS
jgi:putative inorganic carbon (HCO3(-)) transporter